MTKVCAILLVSFLLGMIHTVSGQSLPEPASVIPLYEGVAPGSENWDWEENTAESYRGLPIVQNVVKPVLMYYPPDPGTDVGTAMVIGPGGGFKHLMISYEGVDLVHNFVQAIAMDAEGKLWVGTRGGISVLDGSVGLILETLDHLELSDNTMVVFFSDNGGVFHCFADAKGEQITDMTPLRGEKGGILEGGIRVPMIVRWPGKIRPNSVCHTPVVSVDFLPTFTGVAGISLPEKQLADGVSLVPLLTETGQLKSREIFSYFPDYHHDFPGVAVRQGDYKLIKASEDGHLELYNLADDPGEGRNLASSLPEKAEELHRILMDWLERVGARSATPNPEYDPRKEHILDPDEEEVRLRYLPVSLPSLGVH